MKKIHLTQYCLKCHSLRNNTADTYVYTDRRIKQKYYPNNGKTV